MIGVTKNREKIPECVLGPLSDSALLFLGFHADDWSFRVLLRSILSADGSESLKDYDHVAAQIEPDEDRLLEPERALRYLEGYFAGAQINLYWGSVHDFMTDLLPHWQNRA